RAGAAEPQVPDRRTAGQLQSLSRCRAARLHHLRVLHARRRERQRRARARSCRAGQAAHRLQAQPDSVQPVPRLGPEALAARARRPSRDVPAASDQTNTARRAQLRLELASGYFGRGQTTTALDEVKQALALDPNLAEGYNLRGLIYAGMGEERLADESFRH